MTNLKDLARGKPCLVRLPGICDGGGESGTAVLAHYRLAGHCGVGNKPSDLLGAWCCAPCHAASPERSHDLADGVMRTITELQRLGVIKII